MDFLAVCRRENKHVIAGDHQMGYSKQNVTRNIELFPGEFAHARANLLGLDRPAKMRLVKPDRPTVIGLLMIPLHTAHSCGQ